MTSKGVAIGGGDSDDDTFNTIPNPSSTVNTVEIMPNQFEDDSEEEKCRDMGTDYDPPTRKDGEDEYQMSDATFKLIQSELGTSGHKLMKEFIQNTDGSKVTNTKKEEKKGKEEEKKGDRKKRGKRERWQDKKKRVDDWENRGNKG